MIRRDVGEVYLKALAGALAVCGANLLVEKQFERIIHDRVLCWAAAFATVQTGIVLFLSIALLGWRSYARLRENLYEQIRPAIRDRVSALAFAGESWSSAVPRNGPGRQVLEETIARTLSTVKAAGRDRVARFAIGHGFAAQWRGALGSSSKDERKRAVFLLGLISPVAGNAALLAGIRDEHAAVRAEAYRALLVAGDAVNVEQVFHAVLEESLLMRALLADDLKRHAGYLLGDAIPRILEGAGPGKAARCFEILVAWKRAIPSLDVRRWLVTEQDPWLSTLVLRLLPYVLTDDASQAYVAAALGSAEVEVQCAACDAAGQLKLRQLIPALESALREERRLALAAANALAHMGEAGALALEKTVAGADRKAAAVAMEALERAMVRR